MRNAHRRSGKIERSKNEPAPEPEPEPTPAVEPQEETVVPSTYPVKDSMPKAGDESAGLISILISLAIASGGVLYASRRFDEK